MDIYLIILMALSLLAIAWQLVLVPWLTQRGVSPALLSTVTLVVHQAVRAAEQFYKLDKDVDRKAYAKSQIQATLQAMGINPAPWSQEIEWLIEAAVNELPKTHSEN